MNASLYPALQDSASTYDHTIIRNHFHLLHYAASRARIPGKLVLAAFGGGYPKAQSFDIGDYEEMAAAAMDFSGTGYNLYSPLAIMRPDLPPGSKGAKDDVISVLGFVVDGDADKGKTAPVPPVAANYVIETSAGNLQHFLLLDEPLTPGEAEPFGAALKEATGGADSITDYSHVWRVPGCLNYPNVAKLKRGRSPEPQPVRVHKEWDRAFTDNETLRAALAKYKPEPVEQHSDEPPALNGYRIEEVSWWLDQKIKGSWKDDPDSPLNDNGEWIATAKAIKLNFPDDDGWTLVTKFTRDPDALRPRWDKKSDFKTEYVKGMRTLKNILEDSRDIDWMWRHCLSDCPKPPPGPPVEIPQEILDALNAERERHLAAQIGPLPEHPELTAPQADALSRFWAHIPSGKMLEETSRSFYVAGSVDKHVGRIKEPMKTGPGIQASTWLSQNRYVDSVGWDPDKPTIVEDRIFVDEWIPAPGKRTFNLYMKSAIVPVEGDVSMWLNHINYLYPDEAQHIVTWCAHRVQRPGEKVNHGLVFIGEPGIGKDIAVEPVIAAVGAQNFKSISAKDFFKSDFNAYLESVLLRIDEVHDLGGESKYAFHDRLKTVMAAPPASHYINAKHVPHHSARNVCGVILTSNHTDALYIEPLDRRHFVCISDRRKAEFPPGYFDALGEWLATGGNEAVAYLLSNLDISTFRPKGEPPKTTGWHRIVAAGLSPESGDLADVIEALANPAALTIQQIQWKADPNSQLRLMLNDPKLRKIIPKRLGECGYVVANKRDTKDGRWRTASGRIAIYARRELSEDARLDAATALAATLSSPSTP